MMANPSIIQKQIKDNSEDLHNFVRDLKLWEEEMKRKDRQLSNEPSDEALPPVRKPKYSEKPKTFKDEKNEKKRIKSSDYKAWEQFDVDKACEDIDNEVDNHVEEQKQASPQEDEKYLKEKALYDKELGNTHFANEKWDEAIDCYTRAITTYPKDPVFFANRALCYLKKREYSRVEQDCTMALKLDVTYLKAYMRRAAAREALGFFNDARSDLKKVLDVETNNLRVARDWDRVCVKAANAEREYFERKENPEWKPKKRPEPKVNLNKSLAIKPKASSSSTSSNSLAPTSSHSQGKLVSSEPKWEPCDNIVEPVVKPPHLRSKTPLKRIEIHDVGLNAPEHVCTAKLPESKALPTPPTAEQSSSTATEPKPRSVLSLPSAPLEATSVPPPPRTSVQFHLSWSSIKDNKSLCYQFLKQIPGAELPDIFKDSLESKMFSSIVEVLASEFMAAKESVLPYLRGLSGVRRFSTLALFMSPQDKACLTCLFDYCSDRGDCTPQEIMELKKLFEMS